MKLIKTSESQIQSTVLDYLIRKNHFVLRINNTPPYDPVRKAFRKMPKGTRKGVPDILVQWNGMPVWLEIKRTGGKQSPEQKKFEEDCDKQGIEYHIIRKLDDVIEIGL